VLTHSYLDAQNKRTRPGGYTVEGNLGEGIWQKLVSETQNIFLVLCGHVLGEGRLTSTGKHGQVVHQLLCDYQGLDDGGKSWLRYMTFYPLEDRIEVYTYNPFLDEFNEAPTSRFDLSYPMLRSETPGAETSGAEMVGSKMLESTTLGATSPRSIRADRATAAPAR